jgi:tetratricopeptide (TPR) repeat protein
VDAATVEDVLRLLKERPDDAELYQQLADLYFERGSVVEAWEAFMQSLRLNPDDPFTCLKFGTLLMLCEDKKYARELFEHAIDVDPELAVAHWCLGNLFRMQGEYDLAERAYERAVEVDPDDEQAQEKLVEWRAFITRIRAAPAPPTPGAEPSAGPDSAGV